MRPATAPPRTPAQGCADPVPTSPAPGTHSAVCLQIDIGRHVLAGELALVPQARGLVVFAQGRGGRGMRHALLTAVLHGYRLDTLQFDLLSEAEGQDRERMLDIDLLRRRLTDALRWVRADGRTGGLCTGLFGAGAGAAAALHAAARHPGWVAAVVSQGGRADLAGPHLAQVLAPTLLIVGGQDAELLRLNRDAARRLGCDCRLEVVPGATHRFEQPGAIETVAHLAGAWFAERLRRPRH